VRIEEGLRSEDTRVFSHGARHPPERVDVKSLVHNIAGSSPIKPPPGCMLLCGLQALVRLAY